MTKEQERVVNPLVMAVQAGGGIARVDPMYLGMNAPVVLTVEWPDSYVPRRYQVVVLANGERV